MKASVEALRERAAAPDRAKALPLSICLMLVRLALREEEARKGCVAEKTCAAR